ncbi:hypothetical protein GQX73_g1181 [Xylaria multiplex]|uniref:SprT-like domain-containing protein n=1 Tax=Xylaria multiplex TaxID=323545 RepID=A0A7C8IX90_9PEZI|nr:hypothetical protein GQX73_g1181 [Xylaria multiplex]
MILKLPKKTKGANTSPPRKLVNREILRKKIKEVPVIQVPKVLCLYANWWIWREPKAPNAGSHPAWPGYTGVGTKLDFQLQIQAYESRTLVENTVFSFLPTLNDRNLTPTQISARAEIISLYKNTRGYKAQFNTDDMRKFMRLFDRFFFFGAMANSGRPRLYCKLWNRDSGYAQGPSFFSTPQQAPLGFTCGRHVLGYGRFAEIHIAGPTMFNRPKAVTLCFLLETLVHEMVHAYLSLFTCRCGICRSDLPSTTGMTGHGKAFLMLLDCIDYTLRKWGVGLSGLFREEFSYGGTRYTCDEITCLYHVETEAYKRYPLSALEEPSDLEEIFFFKSTEPANNEAADIQEPVVRGSRPLNIMGPGQNVYLAAPRVGGTAVSPLKLEQTGDIVQALIAKETIRNEAKRKSRHRQKLGCNLEKYMGFNMNMH